jgi:hypothetical protein
MKTKNFKTEQSKGETADPGIPVSCVSPSYPRIPVVSPYPRRIPVSPWYPRIPTVSSYPHRILVSPPDPGSEMESAIFCTNF